MKSKLTSLKKALFGGMAFIMAVTLISPASAAYAAENGTQTEAEASETTELRETNLKLTNRTTGRSGAMTVKEPVVSDIEAPEAGKRLDNKALVTTAEKEQWEIPVLWVSNGQVISGASGDNQTISNTAVLGRKYLPVIAYVVPENYTIANTDDRAGTYMLKFTKEVTKLFGDSQIITIYDNSTGITYLLPASLKDLFAAKAKDSSSDGSYCSITSDENDCNCNPNAVSDSLDEGDGEWDFGGDEELGLGGDDGLIDGDGQEKPVETALQKLVRIHCNDAAKKAFSQDDLEFLADLIINRLQPQAINLILESFPYLRQEASEGGIGKDVGLEIDYDPNTTTYGYARNLPLIDNGQFAYYVSINTAMLVKDSNSKNPEVTRGGENIIELANTMVHEFFHVFMYDYNRTGMIGMTTPTEVREVNGLATEKYLSAHFPFWFIEGTASAVEHNWRGRPVEFKTLRREFSDTEQYRDFYDRQLLLRRYVLGLDQTQDDGTIKNIFTYDLACSEGFDSSGNKVDTVGSRYTAGYLATLYLCELAARSSHGSSITRTGESVTFDNESLKKGLDNILQRVHNGESLDTVINSISEGRFQSTADFEAKFIKGPLTEGYYYGDNDSIAFAVDFMNYMMTIDAKVGTSRQNVANGSILFDFEQDFAIPLDPNKYDTTKTLSVYPAKSYVYSTVNPVYAHTSGGKSVSGTPMGNNVVPFPGSDSQAGAGNSAAKEAEGVPAPGAEAAKEVEGVPAPGTEAAKEVAADGLVDAAAGAEDDSSLTAQAAAEDDSSLDAGAPAEDAIVEDALNSEESEVAAEDANATVNADAAEDADETKSAAPEEASVSTEAAEEAAAVDVNAEKEVAADGTSSTEAEVSTEEISDETAAADAITEN